MKKIFKRKNIVIFAAVIFIIVAIIIGFNVVKLRGTVPISEEYVTIKNDTITMNISNAKSDAEHGPYFNVSDIILLNLTVNFDDSSDGIVKIKLPEGLSYRSFPVKKGSVTQSYETALDDDIDSIIEIVNKDGIVIEERKVGNVNNVVYGDLEYKIKKTEDIKVDAIRLKFAIEADQLKYYGNKEFKIEVEANGTKLDCNIDVLNNFYNFKAGKSALKYTTDVFASSSNETEYGNLPFIYFDKSSKTDGIRTPLYYKKAIYTFYLPKFVTFNTLIEKNKPNEEEKIVCGNNVCKKAGNNFATYNISTYDNATNKLEVIFNRYTPFVDGLSVYYKTNINETRPSDLTKPITIWETPKENEVLVADNIYLEFYDDKGKMTLYSTIPTDANKRLKNIINLYHKDSFVNMLTFENAKEDSSNSVDDHDETTYIVGPRFNLIKTPGAKENLVFEYTIDPKYKAVGVSFQREPGVGLKNIYYKTNKNNTWKLYGEKDKIYFVQKEKNNINLAFHKFHAGLSADEYFTAVKATVPSMSDTYGNFYRYDEATSVYGTLAKDATSAEIKLQVYDPKLSSVTIKDNYVKAGDGNYYFGIERTRKVKYSEDVKLNAYSHTTSFRSVETNNKIDSISAGKEFLINSKMKISYSATNDCDDCVVPQTTRLYIDNVEIYVRQPKGLTLQIDNLDLSLQTTFYDREKEDIYRVESTPLTKNDYTITSKENKHGDIIYKISLKNKKTRIGYGLGEESFYKLSETFIEGVFKFRIHDDCDYQELKINETISFGSSVSNFVSSQQNVDINDLNQDGNYNDYIFELDYGKTQNLLIIDKEALLTSTYITKDNEEYLPYYEANPETIITLYPKEEFEYNIKIKNNTKENINDYELYLPIPKKNTNYGERFQVDKFNWDINLVEQLEKMEKIEVLYSTDRIENKVVKPSEMNFTQNVSDLDKVTMIKIKLKKVLLVKEEFKFQVKMRVDEDVDSKDSLKLNIWNSVIGQNTSNLVGTFGGNKVAVRLFAPSLKGLVYLDLNKNKAYEEDIDIPGVSDIEIELYKYEDEEYKKVKNLNVDPITGKFKVDEVKELINNKYAIKLNSNKYQLNSDITTDGWIKDMTFVNGEGYYYEIGYISDEFAPSIKAEDAYLYVGDKIEFETYIKEAYDYKKEKIEFVFGEKGNTTYSSDIPNNNGIATKVGIYYATYEVTDKYGNKASTLIKIYVRERPVPPKTEDDVTKYIVIGMLSLIASIISFIILKLLRKK